MTTPATCKTCKWWGPKVPGLLSCVCGKSHQGDGDDRVQERDMMRSDADAVGGMVVLMAVRTGPDFGCIHHEAREF